MRGLVPPSSGPACRPPEGLQTGSGSRLTGNRFARGGEPQPGGTRCRSPNESVLLRKVTPAGSGCLPRSEEALMAKVLCVLYDDPADGYPKSYARDEIPRIASYPGGQTTPTPHAIDFVPGELLGSVSGKLGLRKFLE